MDRCRIDRQQAPSLAGLQENRLIVKLGLSVKLGGQRHCHAVGKLLFSVRSPVVFGEETFAISNSIEFRQQDSADIFRYLP
jgi:hypothetical protein